MTCKDCIHYEVCQDGVCDECFTEETPKTVREMYSPQGCETFKNKADFVEVVRCKDCRNRIEKNWAKCAGKKPDDFCSDGESRWNNG